MALLKAFKITYQIVWKKTNGMRTPTRRRCPTRSFSCQGASGLKFWRADDWDSLSFWPD